jgi:hypothetical protein
MAINNMFVIFVSIVLVLFVGISIDVTDATLPPTISYYVTVRSFMASNCRTFNTNPTLFNDYCPNSTSIQAQVIAGEISGHPDFERRASSNQSLLLYTAKSGGNGTRCYNGKYAKFGKFFPITNPVTNGKCPGSGPFPFVLSDLVYGTSGIGKMVYCASGEEGYICDFNQTTRAVFNKNSFSTWYEDDPFYNRRLGYKQTLYKVGNEYSFDSTNPAHDPDNFFDPIQDSGKGSKGWPLSIKETTISNRKFWETSEIHTSFEYIGGESFTFTGDVSFQRCASILRTLLTCYKRVSVAG